MLPSYRFRVCTRYKIKQYFLDMSLAVEHGRPESDYEMPTEYLARIALNPGPFWTSEKAYAAERIESIAKRLDPMTAGAARTAINLIALAGWSYFTHAINNNS